MRSDSAINRIAKWWHSETNASTFQSVPIPDDSRISQDKSIVRIYRKAQWYGRANAIIIMDNGELIGRLGFDRDLLWARNAGELYLEGYLSIFNVRRFKTIHMTTLAGRIYEFKAEFPGWFPISNNGFEFMKSKLPNNW